MAQFWSPPPPAPPSHWVGVGGVGSLTSLFGPLTWL